MLAATAARRTVIGSKGPGLLAASARPRRARRALAVWAAAVPIAAAAVTGGRPAAALAGDQYWDINGATPGAGSAPTSGTATNVPNGVWDSTTPNWAPDDTGTATTATWASGNTAYFSAAATATGNFAVTLSGTQTASGITFQEGGTITFTGTGSIGVDPTNGLTINSLKTSQTTFGVAITGTGNVTVSTGTTTGRSQVNFTVQHTFDGDLILTGGTSSAQNRLQMDYGLAKDARSIRLRGTYNELGTTNIAGNTEWKNAILLNDDNQNPSSNLDAFFYASANRTLTMSGAISGSKTNVNYGFGSTGGGGNGTVILNAINTYSGDTYVCMDNSGVVMLGIDNPMPQSTNLSIGGTQSGATSNKTENLDLNGHTLTVGSLASKVSGASGSANVFSFNGPASLVLGGVKSTTYAGTIGASGNAGISVTKNGTGTQTFSLAQTYTGTTTVNGGTLVVAGLTGSNATVSGAGATLASTGSAVTVRDVTLSDGGSLAPGRVGTVAALTTGTTTFNDGGRLSLDWSSGTSFDTLTASSFVLDGGTHYFDLNLPNGIASLAPGSYTIATATGGITWDGSNGFTPGTLPATANYSFSLGVAGNNLVLNIAAAATTYRWSVGGANPPAEGSGAWAAGSTNFVDTATLAPVTWSNAANANVVIGGDATQNGGTITLGGPVTVNGLLSFQPVTSGSPYTLAGAGPLTLGTNAGSGETGLSVNTTATIQTPVALANSQTWAAGSAGSLTVTGPITGAGLTLTKTGAGLVQLNAAGGSLAALDITGGAVLIGASDAIGAATPVSVANNAEFGINTDGVSFAGPITIGSGGGQLVATGTAVATLTGTITASSAVTKNGSGVLVLTGTNTIPSWQLKGFSGSQPSYVAVASAASLGSGPITLNGGGIRALADLTLPNDLTFSGTGANNATPGAGFFDRIDTNGHNVTLTGTLSGGGDLVKVGGGSLTFAATNSVTGGALYVLDTSTLVAPNASSFGIHNIAFRTDGTINTPGADVLMSTIRGDNGTTGTPVTVHKTGSAALVLGAVGSVPGSAGPNTKGSTLSIDEGAVQLNSIGGAGGNAQQDYMNVVVNAGTELRAQFDGERLGGSITLAGGAIVKPDQSQLPASDTVLLQTYGSNSANGSTTMDHGAVLTVTASSAIRALTQATSTKSTLLGFTGPVVVNSGATLTIENQNAGGYDANNVISFRGSPDLSAFPNDAMTIQAGATVVTAGPGQVRFGRTTSASGVSAGGKVFLGQGTPGSESVLQLSANTFLYDNPGTASSPLNPTRFVVAGSGGGGLRIEAGMNAAYRPASDTDPTHHDGTTGLFGTNGTSATNNHFTVLSPVRLAALSTTVAGKSIGGTLTVAATDATDAVGAPITSGPASPVPLTLAFDNAAPSANANLTYRLDGSGPSGGTLANFAHLQAQKSFAGTGSVTLALAGNTKVADVVLLNGARMDLTSNVLAVDYTGSLPSQILPYLEQSTIYSSVAAADPKHITTLARFEAADYLGITGTAFGLAVDATTLLVKTAYYGDINLDNRIDADDYALMDRAVAKALPATWFNGDFDADGSVGVNDYRLLDTSFGATHGNNFSPEFLAMRQAQFGDAYVSSLLASVPEPGSLGVITTAAALTAAGRRRRRPQ